MQIFHHTCIISFFTMTSVHDFGFTSAAANHLLTLNDDIPQIIWRKSDNCAVQYKCRSVFNEYKKMAEKNDRKVIIYYGPSGHVKGLVDAMSGFGMKGCLKRSF